MKKLIYLLLLYGILRCIGGKEFLPAEKDANSSLSPKWQTNALEELTYYCIPFKSVPLAHQARNTEDNILDLEHTHEMPDWPNSPGGKINVRNGQYHSATPPILQHHDFISYIIIPVFVG